MTTEATQIETPPSEVPAAEPDERAALVAAVKAAKGEQPAERTTPERDETGKFKPKPKAKAEPKSDAPEDDPPPAAAKDAEDEALTPKEGEAPLNPIARAIRQREREQARRDEAAELKAQAERRAAEADRRAAEADARAKEADRILAEANEKLALFNRLRESPREAAKHLAWDEKGIEEFAHNALAEGKPETVAMRQLAAKQAELDKGLADLKTWREEQAKLAEARKAEDAQQAEAARVEAAHRELISHVTTETTPNLIADLEDTAKRLRWSPQKTQQEFISLCYDVAQDYHKRTGQVASLPEIVEYLEQDAASRRVSPPQQASGANGSAAKAKANGQRSLSAAAASERRATSKPIQEMDPDEEKDFLVKLIQDVRD